MDRYNRGNLAADQRREGDLEHPEHVTGERVTWPVFLLQRARRPIPPNSGVVPGSTPVVSFGNPLAEVATLAINPSSREFLDNKGALLVEPKRRLATRTSVGAEPTGELTPTQAAEVVDDCAAYFQRNPYQWFKRLNPVLVAGLGKSYWTGGVCHLDLIQWATDPLWSYLPKPRQQALLWEDEPFLLEQLSQPHLKLVLVNGLTALNGVESAGLLAWEKVEKVTEAGVPTFSFYRAEAAGCLFLAWSVNVPNQHGGTAAVPALGRRVAEFGAPALQAEKVGDASGTPLTRRGHHCATRDELVHLLQQWLSASNQSVLGDIGAFGGSPWVTVTTSAGVMRINADTKRGAIQRVVDEYRVSGGAPWIVVANRRGRYNRVERGSGSSTAGWYAYLVAEAAPGTEVK